MARQYEFQWGKKAALPMEKSLIQAAKCLRWNNWTRAGFYYLPTRSRQPKASWPQLVMVPRWSSLLLKPGRKHHN